MRKDEDVTKVLIIIGKGDHQPRGRMWEAIMNADLVVRLDPGLQSAVVIKDREHPTPHAAQILHAED